MFERHAEVVVVTLVPRSGVLARVRQLEAGVLQGVMVGIQLVGRKIVLPFARQLVDRLVVSRSLVVPFLELLPVEVGQVLFVGQSRQEIDPSPGPVGACCELCLPRPDGTLTISGAVDDPGDADSAPRGT